MVTVPRLGEPLPVMLVVDVTVLVDPDPATVVVVVFEDVEVTA